MYGIIQAPNVKGIALDSHYYCGRFLGYNDEDLILIQNQSSELLHASQNIPKISFVEVSEAGDICVISSSSFFINSHYSQIHWKERIPFRKYQRRLTLPKVLEEKQLLHHNANQINILISPENYFNFRDESERICESTLIHLLEFSASHELDRTEPIQMPAYPNQYYIVDKFPENANNQYIELYNYIQNVNADLDLFGLRYILAIHETNKPPTFEALWLSFSATQSQICNFLADKVNIGNISQYYLAACIKEQRILESIIKSALQNTWNEYRKPELVALLHIAMGNISKLPKLYENIGDSQRASFFKKDFTIEKNKKSVIKNAYSSLSHHGFDMAAALFLAIGDISSAISVIVEKMKDPMLAFLVLRLIEKSFNGEHTKKFIETQKWDDELIYACIMQLVNPEQTPELLKQYLLQPRRVTPLGDPRVAVFQILYHLTRSTEYVNIVCHGLMCSGLAPLANFVMKYGKCPYDKPRVAGSIPDELTKTEADIEEDKSSSNFFDSKPSSSSETEEEKSDEDFDFGCRYGDFDDDNSDDWSSSSDEESSEDRINDDLSDDNKEIIEQNKSSTKDIDNNNSFQFITSFIESRIDCLTNLFGQKRNRESSSLAVRFLFLDEGINMIPEDDMFQFGHNLSIFIDYCSFLFLESAKIPITPADLFGLTLYLVILYGDINQPLTYNYIKSLPQNSLIHTIYFATFCIGMWTFSHHLIAQVLDIPNINNMVFLPSDLPPPQALFNSDILAPRFPDSVPLLLHLYSFGQTLDRDRLLITFLIFQRFSKKATCFTTQKDQIWQSKLLRKWMSLWKSLYFYQVAFSSPKFEIPNVPEGSDVLIGLIVETHKQEVQILDLIQKKALSKLATPAIFQNGKICLTPENQALTNFPENITSFTISNIDKTTTRFVVVSDKIYIFTITNKTETKDIVGFDSQTIQDSISVINHPYFELFLLITSSGAYLFDSNRKDESTFCLDASLLCAKFSPSGTKIAFGTTTDLIVVKFEIGKNTYENTYSKHTGPIYAIDWLDSGSKIILGTENGLYVADILTDELYIINSPCTGRVSALHVNSKSHLILFGTVTGKVALLNINKSFETLSFYSLSNPIVSVSILSNLCVFISSDGLITAFNTSNPDTPHSLSSPIPLSSAIVLEDMIIGCGGKSFLIWKIQKKN